MRLLFTDNSKQLKFTCNVLLVHFELCDGFTIKGGYKNDDNGKPIVWPKRSQTFFGGYLLEDSG